MAKFLTTGLRVVFRRWYVVIFLYAALLGPALVFGGLTWSRFQVALQRSYAGRSLLADLDLNVFVDLFAHRADVLAAIPIGALLIGIASMLLWIWLNAATIAAAQDDETDSLNQALRRGGELFTRFLRLWLATIGITVALGAVSFFAADHLLKWTAESRSETTPYWIVGSCGGVAALLLFMAVVIHDHARIQIAATDVGAATAYRWAVAYCLRGDRRTLLLAVTVLVFGFAAWVAYQTIAMLVPATSTPGVVISLLWGQVLLLGRAAARFWYFVAASELQASAPAEWRDGRPPNEPLPD